MVGDVKAPEVCRVCEGEGFLVAMFSGGGDFAWPCPRCKCCQICGRGTDVIGGECGACSDEADRYAVRRADK